MKLKYALRALARYDLLAFLQILGLAVAFCAIYLIYFFVQSERNTDHQFTAREHLYRIVRKVEAPNAGFSSPTLAGPFRELISSKTGVPAQNIVRVYQDDELISHGEKAFFESNVLYVDEHFLSLLDYVLDAGNPATALQNVNSTVISAEVAEKYFGKDNPVGQTLEIEGKGLLEVTGVLAKPTSNSHLTIDFLVNNGAMGYTSKILTDHEAHAFHYYLKLPGSDPEFVTQRLNDLVESHVNPQETAHISLSLQPLVDIYFGEEMTFDIARHNSPELIQTLVWIGIILLVVLSANLINLNIARLFKRARQIGLKQVLGSSRRNLILDWALEIYLSILLATVAALAGCYGLGPYLMQSHQIHITLPDTYPLITGILIFPVLLTFVIAIAPAVLLGAIDPFEAMNGKLAGLKLNLMQHSLLSLQFATAFVMMVLTVVIVKQYQFMQSCEIGLNDEQVLIFDSNNKHSWKNKSFIAEEIMKVTGVKGVASMYGGIPKSPTEAHSYEIEGTSFQWHTAFVQPNAIPLLGIKLVDGKAFDERISTEAQTGVLLNETAASMLGWPQQNLIGKRIVIAESTTTREVIGIIRDYHYDSFKNSIEPLVLQATDWEETFVVKVGSQEYATVLSEIEQVWKKYVPKYPFSYRFLDDSFQVMHAEDTRNRKVIFLFTVLIIIITAMGTLSMVALMQASKVKEVTIRKILGAPLSGILYLFSAGFLKTLLISSILAAPVAWAFTHAWLDDFSYRISLSPTLFLLGFVVLFLVVLTLVVIQSWKTATLNPASRLRE